MSVGGGDPGDETGVEVRFCDAFERGVGWIAAEPPRQERASHALAVDGAVWLVDPIDGEGVEQRVRALGEPAGILQLVDRHGRDCAALAARLGVPHLVTPFEGVPGAPFRPLPLLRNRFWREVALWWPEERVLVCTEAIGTGPYFVGPGERLGVHPALRLTPPRRLRGLEPARILVGHGEGVHDGAATALADALAGSRRRTPRWLVSQLRGER